jgi:hypothetical protein
MTEVSTQEVVVEVAESSPLAVTVEDSGGIAVGVAESSPLAVTVEEQESVIEVAIPPETVSVTVGQEPSSVVDVTVLPDPAVVTVAIPGPAGPPGADAHHIHIQDTASDAWQVAHNLGKRPSVTVVDSAGTVVIGTVQHVDANNLVISFGSPFAGEAILN